MEYIPEIHRWFLGFLQHRDQPLLQDIQIYCYPSKCPEIRDQHFRQGEQISDTLEDASVSSACPAE
jgi:hypothetical protein